MHPHLKGSRLCPSRKLVAFFSSRDNARRVFAVSNDQVLCASLQWHHCMAVSGWFVSTGAEMMLAGELALTTADCNAFIRDCTQRAISTDGLECQEAALNLLHQMQHSNMPKPAVSTFAFATECILASANKDAPAHQLLVQLQQDIWEPLHSVVPPEADTISAYLPALNHLLEHEESTEIIQMILLMAQNGLPGLDEDCCLALLLVMEDHHLDWLVDHFGADFVAQLQAADMTNSESTVMFPAHGLPRLVLSQLSSGMHCFALEGEETPWWMMPVGEYRWQAPHSVPEPEMDSIAEDKGDASATAPEPSAAEQLVQRYGHLDSSSAKKGRRHQVRTV